MGIKSREVYECPAAMTLLAAHRELEFLTQTREMAPFKPSGRTEMGASWFMRGFGILR